MSASDGRKRATGGCEQDTTRICRGVRVMASITAQVRRGNSPESHFRDDAGFLLRAAATLQVVGDERSPDLPAYLTRRLNEMV